MNYRNAIILTLGIACFFGGLWLNRKVPRVVALTGGFLYCLGVFFASFSIVSVKSG